MTPFVTAGAGFLLAVLWFDLMFDMLALRHREGVLPKPVLDSIAGYYGRVTGTARPMNLLIAAVMLATLASILVQLAREDVPTWVSVASLATGGPAILLAVTVTVPNATRLGQRRDGAEEQSRLARAILRDHLLCLVAIIALLVLQLGFG